jgi:D-alanyl-D-alanine carboxypeptidase (penicillin-binding protein 5/6)
LLGQDGIVGIKTGNSDEVGGNLLFAAKTDIAPGKTATIIGVVLGQRDLNAALDASPSLIDSAKANTYLAHPVRAGETVATYTTEWGARTTAVTKKDLTVPAWKGTAIQPKVSLSSNGTSYLKDTKVGSVTVSVGSGSAATTDVVLAGTIPKPSLWWRLTRH